MDADEMIVFKARPSLPEMLECLSSPTVILSEKNIEIFRGLAGSIIEWKLENLFADHASEKALMSRILNINFPRLKKLSLSYVGMETIEGISRIFMPLLQGLWIRNNHLVSLKDLRKTHWRRLQILTFCENKILEAGTLTELPSPQLAALSINFGTKNQVQDLRWVLKLNSRQLKRLYTISKDKRIPEGRLLEQIKGSYNEIRVQS